MKYFSCVPNFEIVGTAEVPVQSAALEKVVVTPELVQVYHQDGREFKILELGISPGIHLFHEPSPDAVDFPLELMWAGSIDLLEGVAKKNRCQILLYPKQPQSFVDGFYGLNDRAWLPFQVRRSDKSLYSYVFLLTPVHGNLLVPLETLSDQYEDYIENALQTFVENVVYPLRSGEATDYSPEVLTRVLDRSEDLAQIVGAQLDYIRERFRSFSRLVVPLIHYANLKSLVQSSVELNHKVEGQAVTYNIKTPLKIDAEPLAQYLSSCLAD